MHGGMKLVCILALSVACAQCSCQRNDPCTTTSYHLGRCVPFEQCPAMVALNKSPMTLKDLNALKAHLTSCGSSIETAKNDALVCCASPAKPIPSTTTQSTRNRPPPGNAPGSDLVSPSPTPTTTVKPGVFPSLCGSLPPANHIYGGVEDDDFVHGWSVFLDLGSKGRDRCAGSVITDRHVLTAAHCLDNKKLDDITMYFGIYDLREMAQCLQEDKCLKRKPSEFFVHYEYYVDKGNNDIAIIRFDQRLNMTHHGIEAICFPRYITYDELLPMTMDDGTVVNLLSFGWGETDGGDVSHTRRVVMLNVTVGSECENSVYSKTMCTHGVIKGQDVCQGDSGAPLLWIYKKQMYVVGVVSSGPKCGLHHNKPSRAMRISHFKDWVIAKIGS